MIFNQPGDWSEVLYYDGEYYSNGTEIMLTDEYINTHTYNGKKIWKYAYFNNKVVFPDGTVAYSFHASRTSWLDYRMMGIDYNTCRDYAPYFNIYPFQLSGAIQEFTKPITLTESQKEAVNQAIMDMIEHPKTDWDYPELVIGWIVYIIAMIGSLIFTEFYIPWLIATYIFYQYRKSILNQ